MAELEDWAKRSAEYAMGRGKNGKGRNEGAMRIHDEWAADSSGCGMGTALDSLRTLVGHTR